MNSINWLYSNSPDNKTRYILGKSGDNPLVCIGVNPSTAEPENLDPTLRQVKARALSLGYDSWIMINLYPQRATNPDDIDADLNHEIHQKNLEEIKRHLPSNCDIWAAWGTLIEKRPYLSDCLKDLYNTLGAGFSWYTVGNRSKSGHPHHPLYLGKELPLDDFDIEEYIGVLP